MYLTEKRIKEIYYLIKREGKRGIFIKKIGKGRRDLFDRQK